MLEETAVDVVLLEYNEEGMDTEALAYQISQRFPSLPIILLSAHSGMRERILWLVDEYVMKSELPEGLVRVIKRVTVRTKTDETHTVRAKLQRTVPA
jgi:two-component SAPR family response regulator